MNGTTLDPVIESRLKNAQWGFRWLRFWRLLSWLALAEIAGLFLLGVAMWRGWWVDLQGILVAVALLALLVVLGLPAIVVASLGIHRDRQWAADQVEKADDSLLDRLTTLVHLKEESVYAARIERQATRSLLWEFPLFSTQKKHIRQSWWLATLLLVGVFLFYFKLAPYRNVLEKPVVDTQAVNAGLQLPDEPIVDAEEIQQKREDARWGEVRITEPGRDLKVTKVDVVPLQIEAATSHPLNAVHWVTTSGEASQERSLPPPDEPRYAVYQPYLYVDELRLEDWDVMTYYAGARAGESDYRSEIYFLEIRPFREEIEKIKSGKGGEGEANKGYDLMGKISAIIDRQKRVLRATHGFLGRLAAEPRLTESLKKQDQQKLIETEEEIDEAVGHLYAEMAVEMENMAIAEVLDQLALADEVLDQAVAALRNDPKTAPHFEQKALAELVATRKALQRTLNESQGQSNSEPPPPNGMEDLPVAQLEDKLEEMAEYRDEEKAARELVDALIEEQQEIATQIDQNPSQCSGLAPGQGQSAGALDRLRNEHPKVYENVEPQAEAAERALDEANKALQNNNAAAAAEAQAEALAELERLREDLSGGAAARQLADAYRLKKMLDEEAREMKEMAADPEKASQEAAERNAEAARETTRQLKELIEESRAGEKFGPKLDDALSDDRQAERERQLENLKEAANPEQRGQAAERAAQGLEELAQAFDESAPHSMGDKDPLRPDQRESLAAAIRQLQAMTGQQGGQNAQSLALRRETLENLRDSLPQFRGEDAKTLLEESEEALAENTAFDMERLRQLLERLERFRHEMIGIDFERPDVDLAHINPSDLPAEYRERIQNYFRRLSEN